MIGSRCAELRRNRLRPGSPRRWRRATAADQWSHRPPPNGI